MSCGFWVRRCCRPWSGWDLYQATHSPLALGNVGLVQIVPVLLFTFAAGHVADRYDRRTNADRRAIGGRGHGLRAGVRRAHGAA